MKKSILSIMLLGLMAFTASGEMRNVKLQSQITTLEPMKGIVFWPDQAADQTALQNSISLEYSYCLPCKVVTGKNDGAIQYDWSSFESMLDDIASRGHQAIVRFRYEYPGEAITDAPYCTCNQKGATAVPLYIKNGDYGYSNPEYSKTVKGDGLTFYSDWTNDELKWFTKQFYTDFAAKYDNDPRIAFLQVGFGHWSEYHIYDENGLPDGWKGKYFPSDEYQSEFLKHISSTFKETPWSISIDAADDSYTPVVNSSELMALNFGLFDDSFMHSEHEISQGDGYNEKSWASLGSTRWQSAPCGGEISYYTDDDQKNFLNPAGMYGFTWEQAAAKYHITYIIGNDAPEGSYATPARVLEAGQNAGYSFQITKYQVSSSEALVAVKNNGIAPIYHNAYVTVKGTRSSTSLKGLLPGETMECTVTGLSVSDNEAPALTITSDKLLEGVTIPYAASLDGTGLSAPTISLSASSAKVKPNTEVTLTAAVSSENGSISSVTFKKDDVVMTTVTTSPYTYSFTPAEEGTYKITAVVKDEKNLEAESSPVTIECQNGPTEDFESLSDGSVKGSTGNSIATGSFKSLGDILISGNSWNLTGARLASGSDYNNTDGGSKALRMQTMNAGVAITPLLVGKQTVSFYVRLYKSTKTGGGSIAVYSSADEYASPIKEHTIAQNDGWTQISVELNESSDVKLKIVNTTTGSGTDYSVLLDDFTFVLSSGAATSAAVSSKSKLITVKPNQLEFDGNSFNVQIFTVSGQLIATTSSNKYDTSCLPNGVYIVKYSGVSGTEVARFVK